MPPQSDGFLTTNAAANLSKAIMDQTLINIEFETTDPLVSVVQNLDFAIESRPQPYGAKFKVVMRIERVEDAHTETSPRP